MIVLCIQSILEGANVSMFLSKWVINDLLLWVVLFLFMISSLWHHPGSGGGIEARRWREKEKKNVFNYRYIGFSSDFGVKLSHIVHLLATS